MKDEKDKELDRRLFDFGVIVLGKDSRGLIAKLKNMRGGDATWNLIKSAHGLSEPREYVAAALQRDREEKPVMSEEEIARRIEAYRQKRMRDGWL